MKTFQELTSAGFDPRMIEALRRAYGDRFLPLQQEVLDETGLLRGESLLVSAPTASGKTLLAELAALSKISRGRWALYLVPTRALAEQKAREFKERYRHTGVQIACSTRDRREDDEAILKGEIHLAVVVYEKAFSLLTRQAMMLARLGVVIADEVQLLGDANRGGAVDLFLTRWKRALVRPQLLALSAVLGNAGQIAEWLGVQVHESETRPVPLREGVLNTQSGIFRWRDVQTGEEGREELIEDSNSAQVEVFESLARNAGPLIVFCATKNEAARLAFELAERQAFARETRLSSELSSLPTEKSREVLEELIPNGIGLHTADMPNAHRHLVEEAFERGELPILVATPTLEQGVNLVAETVVHSPVVIDNPRPDGKCALVPIPRARLLNQGGRAGRRGSRTGRSILLAEGEFEATNYWNNLISTPLENVESPLGHGSLVSGIAELVLNAEAITRREICTHLSKSLGGFQRGPMALEDRIERDLLIGVQYELWNVAPDGRVDLSALGEAVARTGIAPRTALMWRETLLSTKSSSSNLACLFLIMLAEEWDNFPLQISHQDLRHNKWPDGLSERLGRSDQLAASLSAIFEAEGGAPFLHHRAARRALLLNDWLAGESVGELELVHGLPSGVMARTAGQAAWLAFSAADVAGSTHASVELIEQFEQLGECLTKLDQADDDWEMFVGDENPPLPLERAETLEPVSDYPLPETSAVEEKPFWRLLFPRANPGAVEFNGQVVELTTNQYRMLEALARSPGSAVSYPDLHAAMWPDGAVEQQQIPYHRRELLKRLLPDGSGRQLIRTRSGWGLMLNLESHQVVFEDEEEAVNRTLA